jgi:hypothetical protein
MFNSKNRVPMASRIALTANVNLLVTRAPVLGLLTALLTSFAARESVPHLEKLEKSAFTIMNVVDRLCVSSTQRRSSKVTAEST